MTVSDSILSQVGAVVIGRNEGERLERCLLSLLSSLDTIVYVDSASTDNSIQLAENLGVMTLSLDMTIKFTAARARNEGLDKLLELNSIIKYVQFVDGDCEVVPKWIELAVDFLERQNDIGVTCGRRRERYPERTIYNKLCDIEWDTPVGLTKACGGDALYRIEAFKSVNGFRTEMIAGEEPELCVRLRDKHWKVWRLDAEMTLHDANMKEFKQWWNRSMRCGHAYAEAANIHGNTEEKHKVREVFRVWVWGLVIPVSLLIGSVFNAWFLSLFIVYPIQIIRIANKGVHDSKTNWEFAFFVMLGKFPEVIGQLKYWANHILKRQSNIIEYK